MQMPAPEFHGRTTKAISLTVNDRAVSAEIEPRLQLADFIREHLALTGTHLGCEHGVCGACTVEIDGAPARSCIAYAVACDGARVRTIEGYGDDPVMRDLREAFSVQHALQCGYCTPGMLVTARDIVLRVPGADEARIRKELAGNLCRCTGYVGIVRAIQSVLAARNAKGLSSPEAARSPFDSASFDSAALRSGRTEVSQRSGRTEEAKGAAQSEEFGASGRMAATEGSRPDSMPGSSPDSVRRERSRAAAESKRELHPSSSVPASTADRQRPPALRQSFVVDHPRTSVWDFFGRLDEVTTCLPGATVAGTPTGDHVDVRLRIKLGPITPEFVGGADVVRDRSSYSATIRGAARDARSGSTTRGEIRYALAEERGGAATRVDIEVDYTLTGALAQFSRSSIAQDIARRMTAAFAQNLEARLAERDGAMVAERGSERRVTELDAGSLFWAAVWDRIKAFFGFRSRR